MLLFRLATLLVICICLGFSARSEIVSVRLAGDGAPTRITVASTVALAPEAFLTAGGDTGREMVVLLPAASPDANGKGTGGVANWHVKDRSLAFNLDAPLAIARVLTLPPAGSSPHHRLIIDLETVSAARYSVNVRKDAKRLAKALAAPDESVELAGATEPTRKDVVARRSKSGARFTIVIDPGHGGKDPGTQALSGGKEKDITLQAAQTLQGMLENDKRYEVFLTREDDSFIELEDRVTLARKWGADLFISLHADAAGSTSIAGASVYTISARGEKRVDKEAGKNNWKIPIEDGTKEEVSGILEDLVKRETKTRSAEFAESLLPELARAGPVLRGTHRNAGFYVLLAPDVPAVLLEMGFLTNAEDAARLKSEKGRTKSMTAVRNGIDVYFDAQELRTATN